MGCAPQDNFSSRSRTFLELSKVSTTEFSPLFLNRTVKYTRKYMYFTLSVAVMVFQFLLRMLIRGSNRWPDRAYIISYYALFGAIRLDFHGITSDYY